MPNMTHTPIGRRATDVLLADVTAVRVMMSVVSLLLAAGFVTAHTEGGAYDTMMRFASANAWACVFGFYGIVELMIAFHMAGSVPKPLLFLFILSGLLLWTFTFLSFTGNQVRPFGAADLTVLAMCFGEVWVGAHTLADAK